VITQLLNYFIFMTHSFAQRKEYASLSQIAFEDTLTGLFNRVKSDEKMAELDKTGDDFCLISLDLNGLKEVNDNAGHPAGDRLLRSFANALYTTFNSIGTCYRIGGDEFLVITSTTDKATIDSLLQQLDKKLLDLDESDPEINHSVSYGYAFRSETSENEAHAAFMLADKKMYDYKRKYYSHMMKR
jgi:diguanylate cyclase (GGDEF)-like protein